MNYFNFQRKLFWSEELVLLPERWSPPEDETCTSGEPCGVERLRMQLPLNGHIRPKSVQLPDCQHASSCDA